MSDELEKPDESPAPVPPAAQNPPVALAPPADPPPPMVSLPVNWVVNVLEAFYDANTASNGQFLETVAQALKDEYISARQEKLDTKQTEKTEAGGEEIEALSFEAHSPEVHAFLEPHERAMLDSLHGHLVDLVNSTGCIKKKVPCPCPHPADC